MAVLIRSNKPAFARPERPTTRMRSDLEPAVSCFDQLKKRHRPPNTPVVTALSCVRCGIHWDHTGSVYASMISRCPCPSRVVRSISAIQRTLT